MFHTGGLWALLYQCYSISFQYCGCCSTDFHELHTDLLPTSACRSISGGFQGVTLSIPISDYQFLTGFTLEFQSRRVLTTFEPTFTCIFRLFRSLFSRLYRALHLGILSYLSITEYQGIGYRHLPNKGNFTTLINLTVKQLLLFR
jgi:hypothetical protein